MPDPAAALGGGYRHIWFHDDPRETRLEFHFSSWSGKPADLEAIFRALAAEGWEGLHLNFSPADHDSNGGLWITGGRTPTPEDEQEIDVKNQTALARHERELAWHQAQAEKIRSGGWDTLGTGGG